MDTVRINPSIPAWLQSQIEADVGALGQGQRRKNGLQSVVMTALLLYLELPEADRRELAEGVSARDERSVRAALDSHWITRLVRIGQLGEDSLEDVLSAAEGELARGRTVGKKAARRA